MTTKNNELSDCNHKSVTGLFYTEADTELFHGVCMVARCNTCKSVIQKSWFHRNEFALPPVDGWVHPSLIPPGTELSEVDILKDLAKMYNILIQSLLGEDSE